MKWLFDILTAFDFMVVGFGIGRDIKETAETVSETGLGGLVKLKGFIHVPLEPNNIDGAAAVLRQYGYTVRRVEYEFQRIVLEHPTDFDSALQVLRDNLIESY